MGKILTLTSGLYNQFHKRSRLKSHLNPESQLTTTCLLKDARRAHPDSCISPQLQTHYTRG